MASSDLTKCLLIMNRARREVSKVRLRGLAVTGGGDGVERDPGGDAGVERLGL
jgi:hypothetical protein